MQNEIMEKVKTISELCRDSKYDTSTMIVVALPESFKLETKLELFGNYKNNIKKKNSHQAPLHISGGVNCEKIHMILAKVSKLEEDRNYLDKFIEISVNYRLTNIFCIF